MSRGPWQGYFWRVFSVGLLCSMFGAMPLQAQENATIHFRWGFGVFAQEGKATTLTSIKEDTTLKTGQEFKLFVELLAPCYVYVLHHGPQEEVQLLFPYDRARFPADYPIGKVYAMPSEHDARYRINAPAGRETFYIFAAAQRLTELEQQLDAYATTPPVDQPRVAAAIVKDVRNLIRQHRAAVQPGRPVPIAGNLRLDVEGVEIQAQTFYSKTITIEHQ
ncbi:MAG: DUF4384 domain-containing protein [Candidatus Tectomicrobia bacterium]|uniref:DUF4384 domain-containing protein n=1 Tax=Tectimicrobiota bacterium TaxID=2528274 RepID=A0A938B5R7_UNCTE|nr:DUF4384 domain-containing protein [Candidatus Tectomicrobia bacterium]